MRICLDCNNLTNHPDSLCTTCRSQRNQTRDKQRGSRQARGYGNTWQHLARQCIQRQPWCTHCLTRGDKTNPLSADHIIPKARGGTDHHDNLQTLCRRCNSAKRDRPGGV